MRNKILLVLGALLLLATVACANVTPFYWSTMVLADSQPTDSSHIMIVFYTIADEEFLFWSDLSAEITDNGDGTWDIASPQVNSRGVNQAVITYTYYKYKEITLNCCDGEGNPLPTYISELGLEAVTANDLPKSQHIGKLTAVDAALAKPATVTRKWMGQTYNVQCLVSQSVVDMWIAGTLEVGDFVVVSFIEEIPDTTEIHVAVVTDKVYESW